MKWSYSSNAYMRFGLEETARRIAAIGFAGLELLADVPHAWPAGLPSASIEAIRAALDRHGLQIANINAFMMNAVADPRQPYWHPSWIEPSWEYRAIRREHTKRAIELAAALGTPNLQTEPGGPIPLGYSRRHALQVFYDELMPCVEMAERLGVDLLIEPEPGLLIELPEQYLEFAERVDSPRLGLNFDIGHFFCVGAAPEQWVPRLTAHTRHYHIEDIPPDRRHSHLVPGRGAIDLAAVLRAIRDSGYQGWVTVELYPYIDQPDEAGAEALRYLQGLLGGNSD